MGCRPAGRSERIKRAAGEGQTRLPMSSRAATLWELPAAVAAVGRHQRQVAAARLAVPGLRPRERGVRKGELSRRRGRPAQTGRPQVARRRVQQSADDSRADPEAQRLLWWVEDVHSEHEVESLPPRAARASGLARPRRQEEDRHLAGGEPPVVTTRYLRRTPAAGYAANAPASWCEVGGSRSQSLRFTRAGLRMCLPGRLQAGNGSTLIVPHPLARVKRVCLSGADSPGQVIPGRPSGPRCLSLHRARDDDASILGGDYVMARIDRPLVK